MLSAATIRTPVLSLLCVLFFSGGAHAYDLVIPSERESLKRGFELVYNGQFSEAGKIFHEYISKYPDRPEGYFFVTGCFAERMNDRHDRSAMPAFKMWADKTEEKAEAFNSLNPKNPTGHFYLGNLYGYMGLLEAQDQNLLSAFLDAVKAKASLEKALELDPVAYDAYFGLGSLYYYGSKKHSEMGGMVGWVIQKSITHGRDMRQDGIGMVQKAHANGGISSDSAHMALMWIMLSEGRYAEAELLAVEASRRWPNNKQANWAQGRTDLARGRCAEALVHFEHISDLMKQANIQPASFPEVGFAVDLSSVCVKSEAMGQTELQSKLKPLRAWLGENPNMVFEYTNSAGAVRDFAATLDKIERRQIVPPGVHPAK